jgi:hypothetical protein
MLFVLIALAWLAIGALCWAVCMMAQRGEVESSPPSADRGGPATATGESLVVWEGLPELTVQDVRLKTRGVRSG